VQELPSIRELLNLHRRRLANAGELPSLKEIELLLKLEQKVEAQEMLERLGRSRADELVRSYRRFPAPRLS
jgi:hypothetical protein